MGDEVFLLSVVVEEKFQACPHGPERQLYAFSAVKDLFDAGIL